MASIREYPIVKFWYGKGARFKTIEDLMDGNPDWFLWALERFQNVTVGQAKHFKEKYGLDIPSRFVEDVPPYEYRVGDPEALYQELCTFPRPSLQETLRKYRKNLEE